MNHRYTKIVCTLGPASATKKVIFRMIRDGLDVARLNFSHGSHESHRRLIELVREGARRYGRQVSILQDLQGIKIRCGRFRDGRAELKRGRKIALLSGNGTGDGATIYVSYKYLIRDAKLGDRILLDDGLIQLRVVQKTSDRLIARVIEGGIITDKKGVNLPGMKISQRAFTAKDRKDLAFGLQMKIDYVAISFVRTASDIKQVKTWMKRKAPAIRVIAKIEKPEALENIGKIREISDGIMVARGDLGVEVLPEKVPLIQKDLINRANKKGKLVITATQMLESMTEHLRPTRAETTDVANAVLDGTDALMLSAETSVGKYPNASLKMMDRIIRHTEKIQQVQSVYDRGNSYAAALADAACRAATDIHATVLVSFTRTGYTARLISKFRPTVPIIAFTPSPEVLSRLPLVWGVIPKPMRPAAHTDQLLKAVEKALLKEKIVKSGDSIVIITSSPLSTRGRTNFMKLHGIGE
ncbi:MAG: pyruvate kinase [Nitrospiraceae bacterium]|nr:MAG: pyruvate kinase [Nitrospiraceae bacterium]